MTDYRDQAATEIGSIVGLTSTLIKSWMDNPDNEYLASSNRNIARWALEREARLRLEDALRDVIFASAGLIDEAYLWEARAVLELVKEG